MRSALGAHPLANHRFGHRVVQRPAGRSVTHRGRCQVLSLRVSGTRGLSRRLARRSATACAGEERCAAWRLSSELDGWEDHQTSVDVTIVLSFKVCPARVAECLPEGNARVV